MIGMGVGCGSTAVITPVSVRTTGGEGKWGVSGVGVMVGFGVRVGVGLGEGVRVGVGVHVGTTVGVEPGVVKPDERTATRVGFPSCMARAPNANSASNPITISHSRKRMLRRITRLRSSLSRGAQSPPSVIEKFCFYFIIAAPINNRPAQA
jgi:hypothetical protein